MEPEDLSIGESMETDPGVVVERRCFLKTAAVALGGVTIPGLQPPRVGAAETLSVDQFIAEALPIARELVKDPSMAGQDRYLLTLAAHAVRLAEVPEPEFRESGQGPGALIGSSGASELFVVLHWKMTPGAEIRRHAHTYGNVVTLGLEGVAQVENYEVVGPRNYDAEGPFRVRRTMSQRLTPGGVNLVNLERNYIHGFKAGSDGARGLDITTRLAERRPTPYLRLLNERPGSEDTYDAVWST